MRGESFLGIWLFAKKLIRGGEKTTIELVQIKNEQP